MIRQETERSGKPLIGPEALPIEAREQFERDRRMPIKVLQIGEGNFLRGFADWMLQACNRQGLFNGAVAVTQPRPSGKPHMDQLKAQNGAYTLLVRGIRDGSRVEERETITVLSRMIDPYEEWKAFMALADNPELEIVISNTTEAGLAYQPSEWREGEPVLSFPGKLTALLYRRFDTFGGDPAKGLVHLPCELLDRNGERLQEIVLKHADDWGLPEAFKTWVLDYNSFLNTLVDRIVTGYPADEAEGHFERWGYADPLLTTAEPYYFWAIQGKPELERKLPLATAGLNVRWVGDLAPYQLRKVRILNGTHTMMATIGLVNGMREVREALEHPSWGPIFMQGLFDEIVPGLPLDRAEVTAYANATLERFRNPYIKHKLSDIAMNSLSKWKARLLPSLRANYERTGKAPTVLTESLASLLRLYRPAGVSEPPQSRLPDGTMFTIRDDAALLESIRGVWETEKSTETAVNAILSLEAIWGEDLTKYPGLAEAVVRRMAKGEDNAR